MNKVEELESKVRELESAILKLKRDFNGVIYDLDEGNFSIEFLKKIGYTPKISEYTSGERTIEGGTENV